MRANDMHGANVHNDIVAECYKPTVNESETITEAQPLCWFAAKATPMSPGARGLPVPAAPPIERS